MSTSNEPDKRDTGSNPGGPAKFPRPPVAPWQNLFWILILVTIPLIGFFFFSDRTPVLQLSQSEFEAQLLAGNVTKAVLAPSSDGLCHVEGIYVTAADRALPGAEQAATMCLW